MFKTAEELLKFLTDNIKVSYKERYFGKPELSVKAGKAMRKIKFRTENSSELYDSIVTLLRFNRVNYRSHLVRGEQSNLEVIDISTEESKVRILVKPKYGNEWRQQNYWNENLQTLRNWNTLKGSPDTQIEFDVLKEINSKISEFGLLKPVTLVIKSQRFEDIIGFIPGEFGAKADFIGINSKGEKVIFISHKAGRNAKDFQQYSGITSKAGNSIYNHKEVQFFREAIASKETEDFYKTTFYREITDTELKKRAVFGKNFGGGPKNENNIHFFCQGRPIITKRSNGVLVLSFNTRMASRDQIGQLDRSGYTPVLAARRGEMYRSVEYQGEKVTGVRGGVFAKGYIDNRTSEQI